jgi:hypothetical protein
MEVKEIVSYFLNTSSNILEVSFRTVNDDEDVLRVDNTKDLKLEKIELNHPK